jgi:hypothetical protein
MPVVRVEAERVEMLRIRTQPVTRTTLGVIGLTRGPAAPPSALWSVRPPTGSRELTCSGNHIPVEPVAPAVPVVAGHPGSLHETGPEGFRCNPRAFTEHWAMRPS